MDEKRASRDEDARAVSACRRGDPGAYRFLVEKYQGRLYALAYGIVLERFAAEDVVQEAFIRGYRSLGTFRGESGFYTWIYRIARNLALDSLRRRRPEVSYEDARAVETPAGGERVDRNLRRKELQLKVRQALAELSPQQRDALVLREWEGLSYREIARAAGCSIGTVMSRIHYARQRVAESLREYWDGEEGRGE